MEPYKFQHGQEAADSITGFKGVITGRADYITGCNQYLLTAKAKTGVEGICAWFDEDRLKVTKTKKKTVKVGPRRGGPQSHPAPTK